MADYPDWTRLFFLVGSSITLDINIAGADVTLPISIDATTVTLDVNLTGQDVDVDINFNDQSVAVFDASEWYALQAQQINFGGYAIVDDDDSTIVASRTVPTGKVFFITGFAWTLNADAVIEYLAGSLVIAGTGVIIAGSYRGHAMILDTPRRATAGQLVEVRVKHIGSAGSASCGGSCWGYDRDA